MVRSWSRSSWDTLWENDFLNRGAVKPGCVLCNGMPISSHKAVSGAILLFECFLTLQQCARHNALNFHWICIDLQCGEWKTNEGVPQPSSWNRRCECACTRITKTIGSNQDYTHTRMQHTHMFMWCLQHRRVCKHVQYIHPHALQICPCWSRRTYARIEEEYEMRRCNYMANVVMIWCLNISAVLCCAGTLAIHSQGQAGSQRHETHESECVHPTRELAVQLEIFMIGSVLKAPRR